jgi:hypothetical protein
LWAINTVRRGKPCKAWPLLNDLGVAARLGPLAHEPDVLAQRLGTVTTDADVFVLDRNFADYAFIAWGVQHPCGLIIRCPRSSFGVVNDFWESDLTDQVVTLHCSTQRTRRATPLRLDCAGLYAGVFRPVFGGATAPLIEAAAPDYLEVEFRKWKK